MSLLVYLFAIAVAAIPILLLPHPYGIILVAGLVLGTCWRLSDRIQRLEGRFDWPEEPGPPGSDPGAEAERNRIRRKMDEYAKGKQNPDERRQP